jgi:beta-galactosidase
VKDHPGQPVFGSETASCISTRGYYLFPVEQEKGKGWTLDAPFQVSSYDLYAPGWASKPDYEWQYEDVVPECAGEFVWTGYDYLGEPTPFNLDPSVLTNFHTEEEREAFKKMVAGWGQTIAEVPLPSRSSYFGIIDLAGFPKDRYWIYQARWRPELPMVHLLPHWTWPGREGQVTPVHVYTSGDEAELFVNGKSMGRKAKDGYRIVWDEVVYEPGALKVVAYKNGAPWAEAEVKTAGKADRTALSVDFTGDGLTLALKIRGMGMNSVLRARLDDPENGPEIGVCAIGTGDGVYRMKTAPVTGRHALYLTAEQTTEGWMRRFFDGRRLFELESFVFMK